MQLLSHVWLCVTLWTAALHASHPFTISLGLLKLMSAESVILPNHLVLCCPLVLFPASELIPVSQLFASGGQSIGPSASAPVLPMNFQRWFPLGLTGLISLLSKGLWKSPSTPQCKSINFLVFRLLHSPILTSTYDHWKHYSFDYMAFCWQSDISAF